MTPLRWISMRMPQLHSSHGSATSQTPAMAVARHVSSDDSGQHITRILLIISTVFASISVLLTLSALFWFAKVRRSFRHEQVPTRALAQPKAIG